MKKSKNNLNTKEFWDSRYSVDKYRTFPYERVYDIYLKDRKDLNWIADYGCGLGEGINYLSKIMSSKFSGADFSDTAIEKAKKYYPHLHFEKIDLNKNFEPIPANMSLIVQTLEHLDKPMEVIEKLLKVGEVLISIPNETKPEGEHHWTFDIKDFYRFPITFLSKKEELTLIVMGGKNNV